MGGFGNFYNYTPTEISAGLIIFNLIFVFILQLVVVYVYKKTRHGLSYSQSFIFTLIIVGVLGSVVMMAVQNNIIGALAIFGAFTLIRFRSILKETSDLAYVFFALVLGISVGMGHYPLALITTLFLSLIIYLFYRFGVGRVSDNFDYLLILSAGEAFTLDAHSGFLDGIARAREVLHIKHLSDDRNEYSISLRLEKSIDPENIVRHFKDSAGVDQVEILTGKNTSEF